MDAVLHSSAKHDWQTPPEVVELVRKVGRIGLDPCASESERSWFAAKNLTEIGIATRWILSKRRGLVYVNPPYGREIREWIDKCIREATAGCEIIALVPSRTDTQWFRRAWYTSEIRCFWHGRITFVGAQAPAPFPSALFYWGTRRHKFHKAFFDAGIIV